GSIQLDPSSDNGTPNDSITSDLRPIFNGRSEQTAFGNTVHIDLFDLTDPANPRKLNSTGVTTNSDGTFQIQVDAGMYLPDGSTDGVKVIGIHATDDAGVVGNFATTTFTLNTRPVIQVTSVQLDPAVPTAATQPNNNTPSSAA